MWPRHTIWQEIRDALDHTCCCETIRSRMREAGLMNSVAAQKPHLTTKQRGERLNFARAFEHWTAEEWREVIFTDESTFSTRWDQQQRVWRPLNSRYLPGHIHSVLSSGRCSVSVWGAISRDGLGPLLRFEGPFTGATYCEVLVDHLIPYVLDGPFQDGCYMVQHDRSPVHKARAVSALLERYAVRHLPWPPYGADLNTSRTFREY
ncbi:hypothetical protein HPB52_024659 [Rhipicephalus sanguineus]|uniref:Transposase Tc1-like domain-containing protein n=1 Tax=Rhipicephalus sanguineus TaxID=34632 RepID=A0A9D4SMD9_RHISA|nr:hypothetical protein HPB52_024659 [Rhipicephalus sanguineus]